MNIQPQVQAQYGKFNEVAKCINKSQLSINPDTLNRYRENIVPAYNTFVQFISSIYDAVDEKDQTFLKEQLIRARKLFAKCLDNLRCTHDLPRNLLEAIQIDDIGQINSGIPITETDTSNRNNSEGVDADGNKKTNSNSAPANTASNSDNPENIDNTENIDNSEDSRNSDDLIHIMEPIDLFNAVNRQFKNNYSGDPLGLTSFIDGIEILSDFATTPDLKRALLRYVRAKLEGRAREFITADVDTIEKLQEKLRANISPESSKVVEGRILALRYAYSKQEEFAEKAVQLADALRRTLIIEGMTAVKANEISVDKTIQLCRKSTSSDLVKSVLASTSFKTPKEVIAKMITENDTHVKEQQILRCQKFDKNQNSNSNNKRGRGRNKYQNNNGQNNGNGQFNNGNRQNGNQNKSYQRGRGNGRQNNNNYNNSNGNNRYQNSNNYGNYNNGGANVRVANSGNELAPQQSNMGGPQFQNFQ